MTHAAFQCHHHPALPRFLVIILIHSLDFPSTKIMTKALVALAFLIGIAAAADSNVCQFKGVNFQQLGKCHCVQATEIDNSTLAMEVKCAGISTTELYDSLAAFPWASDADDRKALSGAVFRLRLHVERVKLDAKTTWNAVLAFRPMEEIVVDESPTTLVVDAVRFSKCSLWEKSPLTFPLRSVNVDDATERDGIWSNEMALRFEEMVHVVALEE